MLTAIRNYILENAKAYKVHRYNLCCGLISFWGGKVLNPKVRLPHGLYDYVKKADKAIEDPAQAAILLGDVLRHAQNALPSDGSKPNKRDPATHAAYRAIATWNRESEIVKHVYATPREIEIVNMSSQNVSGFETEEKNMQLNRRQSMLR